MSIPRIGQGYDVHRLVEGRPLILGGVRIPWEKGLLGHSDADVLLHALMDSLLGAAALGDIGHLFPDSDERYRGADSRDLLREVRRTLSEQGFVIGNVDVTLVAQKPKIAPYTVEMDRKIRNRTHRPTEIHKMRHRMKRILTAGHHAPRDRQRAVKPGRQNRTAILLHIEAHNTPIAINLGIGLDLEPGRIAM